ncbi:hypothetical protein ABR738_37440 [Streptomyces sp. Edi4]|uniref:hypothetical protein n=1 Tax=Streptomyces sp. Edi4 TaxID=3162527 RepID=UPI0033066E2C
MDDRQNTLHWVALAEKQFAALAEPTEDNRKAIEWARAAARRAGITDAEIAVAIINLAEGH